MDRIISKLYETIKDSSDLIATEESIQLYMYEVFAELVGDIFTHLNQTIKEQKQHERWKVKREDWKTVQFIFGPVCYRRTLMADQESQNHYPLDEWLGIRKYQRHSPLVEVKIAELASKCTYRDTAELLKEWTAVTVSHQTVGSLLKRVGEAQAFTATHYALQHAQIMTNSDGGPDYTADKFQETFSQSNYPVLNHLDAYHIFQGLNRAFGVQSNLFKQTIHQAL